MRASCFGIVFVGLTLYVRAAGAVPKLVVDRTENARDCPDASALAQTMRRMTPKAPSPSGDAQEIFSVAFDRGADGYRVRVQITGEHEGIRELVDANTTCASLADAAALTIALVLDPEATLPPPQPAPAREEPPIAPTPSQNRAWTISATAAAGVAAAVVRPASPVFALSASASPSPLLAFELGGYFVPTQSLALERGRVDVLLLGGRGGACLLPLGSSVRVGLCAGLFVGWVRASGHGYPVERSADKVAVAALIDAAAAGPIAGPVGWVARAGAFVPFGAQTFAIDGAGVAYEAPPVGVIATVGPSVTFR